ncbi:MAG: leucine-rich repeat domain-containing protein [Eubacteriales bacterium]|nr:leucine-rich repeat domain-containing protein [Eubacteriales bacterium]
MKTDINNRRISYRDVDSSVRMRTERPRSAHTAYDSPGRGQTGRKARYDLLKRKRMIFLALTVFAAVVIILLAVAARNISDSRTYNGYMDQAKSSYYASDFDSALTYLRKASAIDGTNECLAMMTQCYESLGNYDKALETLRRMDTSNRQVAQWIDDIESRRSVVRQSNMVTVAGKQYKSDTTGIALDHMNLGNSVVEELKQLYSLDNLSLSGNNISDISGISTLGGLTTLNLSNNNISDISSLAALTGLRTLYLDNNPISDISVLPLLANLSTLSIKGLSLTEKQINELGVLLPNCAIHSEATREEEQEISFGGVTFSTEVTELSLSGMGLQNISVLSSCAQLQRLDLSGNSISDLTPLMDMPNLQWLNISGNLITDLRPLMGMSSIRFLNASGNYISNTAPLGSMTGLTELHLSDNNITDFSGLSGLTNLRTLGLNNANLTNEGLSSLMFLGSLSSLNIENNEQLTGEAVQLLKQSIPMCTVTHSELTSMVYFENYAVAGDTYEINLSGLNIYDINSFGQLQHPETVNMARNSISNIYVFQNANNRGYVKHLDLSYNLLQDITPLASLTNLETLDISYNTVSSELPLLALSNLRVLNVSGTLLSWEQVEILRMNLPMCTVISSYG